MKKSAYTLSEVLLALTIIGVVMALVIPAVINSVSDTGGLLYKKAMTDLQNAIDAAKEDPNAFAPPINFSSQTQFLNASPTELCNLITSQYSKIGSASCDIDSSDTTKPYSFKQVNGFTYWNLGGDSTETHAFKNETTDTACTTATSINSRNKCVRTIWLDVNGDTKGKNTYGKDRFKIQIRYDGKVMIGTGEDWAVEQQVLKDSAY